jgi:glucans biosynthesis protein
MMRRREFLKAAVVLAGAPLAFPLLPLAAAAPARPVRRDPRPFDYAWLKGQARALAGNPYHPPLRRLPQTLAQLDYDHYQAIHSRPERAHWSKENLAFRVQFFPLGFLFQEPVRLYEVVNGQVQDIVFDPALFDWRKSGVAAHALPRDLGFAGFRLQFHTNWDADVAAFLGASYFRAVGGDSRQYGLSARGLAIDTALDRGEEFPRFTAFWLERPAKEAGHVTVYALLDSPSVAGAYRFGLAPGATLVMDVDAALYPRKLIERLGVAPLTSMFQCGENDRRMATDWRPEIHDSDGLALWTGAGEWLWRPLVNPASVRVNSYYDANPRGFGLLQRDHSFDHYQDDGVHYEQRPSAWVEPKATLGSGWGPGAVQLVELPTADETSDNIVAFWHPTDQPRPGQELLFSYRLYWCTHPPFAPALARAVATRTGLGGVVGRKRRYFSWRFAVDFVGGELATLAKDAKVEPVINASRGRIELPSARPQVEIDGYRAMFDLRPPDGSAEPVDLRLYLRLHGQPLTETWTYQWTPPTGTARKY